MYGALLQLLCLRVCVFLCFNACCRSSDVSQNFVRLNMKIRRYKRKGQSSTSKFRRHRFGKKDTCYKCGGKGHWARDCPASTNLGTFDGEEVLYCEDPEEREGKEEEDCTAQEESMAASCDVGGVGSTAAVSEEWVEKEREPVLAEGSDANSVTCPEPPATGRKSAKRTVSSSVSTERKRKRAVVGRKAKGKADRARDDPPCEQPSSVDVAWDLPSNTMGNGGSQSQSTDPVVMEEGG